jgi:hypothetical protein
MNESSPLPNVDGVLRAYFRAEMPDPWPQMRLPGVPLPQLSAWRGARLRFALAASVGLFLTGYLALAGLFPRDTAPQVIELQGPIIGKGLQRQKQPFLSPSKRSLPIED